MESKKQNLFIGDRSFAQSWNLSFKEVNTERKYQTESHRFHRNSMKYLFLLSIFLFISLYITGMTDLKILSISLLPIFSSPFCKHLLLKRILLQSVCYTWQSVFFAKGTLPECFGALVPSLFLNFFLLKNWSHSLIFFSLEGLLLNSLNPDCKLNITLSIITFTIVLSSFEKDFRDLWHLYSSFKKSNCLNQALWDNFPGAELIVGKDGKILYYNKCASNLLSKLNYSQDVLKSGQFQDYFSDFKNEAKNLLTKSIKGEMHEEIHITKYKDSEGAIKEASFLITGNLFTWISGNASRIICIDVTTHISRKHLILTCFRDVDADLKQLNRLFFDNFNEAKPANNKIIGLFYKTVIHFKGIEAIQSHFSGEIHVKNDNFDLNAEVINNVEVLYMKSSLYNLSIIYTREQAVPSTVIGDKYLHNLIIFSLLEYSILNALEGTEIYLLIQVALAGIDEITISYKFSFRSEKITNLDIEKLISTRKTEANIKEIDEMQEICDKYGIGLASLNTVLLALKGYLVPCNSEIDPNKVVINICLPFNSGNVPIKQTQIKISKNCVQETPLTVKWKPDQSASQQVHSTSDETASMQISLISQKSKQTKNIIQFCGNIEVSPILSEKSEIFNKSSFDIDICEESDASTKMQTYTFMPIIRKNELFKPLVSLIQAKIPQIIQNPSFADNVVLVDENQENLKSLGNPENFKENIILAENRVQGLEICVKLLEDRKKVTSLLFAVDKIGDKGFIEEVKSLENKFGTCLNLCGLSRVPADLNYCKSIGIKNFSKKYLVVKPITYGQVSALVKKLEYSF